MRNASESLPYGSPVRSSTEWYNSGDVHWTPVFGKSGDTMKFACRCGHVIKDQTDDLPYKADYVANQDWEAVWGALIDDIVRAVKTGWSGLLAQIEQERSQGFPYDRTVEQYVGNFVIERTQFSRRMYECQQCGRLWLVPILHGGGFISNFVSYLPETETRDVLAGVAPKQ